MAMRNAKRMTRSLAASLGIGLVVLLAGCAAPAPPPPGPATAQQHVDTAEALGVSPATVKRGWGMAQAWLYRDLLQTVEQLG